VPVFEAGADLLLEEDAVAVRDGAALIVKLGELVDVLEEEILGVEVRVADMLLVDVVEPVIVRV
jgi:hypothetical protein